MADQRYALAVYEEVGNISSTTTDGVLGGIAKAVPNDESKTSKLTLT